jgi:hypothetical protein
MKGESNDVAAMHPPAPKLPVNFSVDSTDKFLLSYYCEGSQDYADVVFHINRVLCNEDYRVSVATDGKAVSWQHAIQSICFTKKILKSIMGDSYLHSSHCTVAYNDIAQEMQAKKVRPEHKLYWGASQVVRLKWDCTGATTIIKRDYEIDYVNVDASGRRNHQCNSVLIVKVKKTKEHAETEAVVDAGQISLFGAFSQSSHGSSGNPPSPPPQPKRSDSSNCGHEVNDDNEDVNDEDDDDDGGGGGGSGGRRGGGYGGGRGGKRKRGH